MAHWPASFDGELSEGTMYVSPGRIAREIERHDKSGRAFRFRHRLTSYLPNTRLTYRNLQGLKPESLTDFMNIMQSCQAAGLESPPASFADPFKHMFRSFAPRSSWIVPFKGRKFGGWQQVMGKTNESIQGPIYWYDLNSAYRWAACQGLPDMQSSHPLERIMCERTSLYLIETLDSFVKPYWPRRSIYVATNEELVTCSSKSVRMIRGVGFDATIDLTETFSKMETLFPFCYKRISRAFWGPWNSQRGPECLTWRSGEQSRELGNPIYNPVWPAFITSRIKLRFIPWYKSLLHVYVDAMLTREEIPTGVGIGEWRHLGTYQSVWMKWPGYWGTECGTTKHTGIGPGAALPIMKDGHIIDGRLDTRPWRENLA